MASTAITDEHIRLTRQWLADYETLDLRGQPYDPAGWLQLKWSCGRARAERLVEAAKTGMTTRQLLQRARKARRKVVGR